MTATLGVDGGQSGIRLQHSDQNTVIELGGVSRTGDQVAAVADAVRTAVRSSDFPPIETVVLGLTTAPVLESEKRHLCEIISDATGAAEVWLADDSVTAHCGALSGEMGITLTAGTGIACLAASPRARPRAFDGFGYLLGDEGGAFWIGQHALRHALRSRDNDRTSALTRMAEDRYGSLAQLHVHLHEAATPVNEIAQFARDVLASADTVPEAGAIVDAAAERLMITIHAARDYLGETVTPLALGGRLLAPDSPLRRRLDRLLDHEPRLSPRTADRDPLGGCLLLPLSQLADRYGELLYRWNGRQTL